MRFCIYLRFQVGIIGFIVSQIPGACYFELGKPDGCGCALCHGIVCSRADPPSASNAGSW
jgi:hypothetical protein